jgi:hypothetical protein
MFFLDGVQSVQAPVFRLEAVVFLAVISTTRISPCSVGELVARARVLMDSQLSVS